MSSTFSRTRLKPLVPRNDDTSSLRDELKYLRFQEDDEEENSKNITKELLKTVFDKSKMKQISIAASKPK